MLSPTFASAYEDVKHKSSGRLVRSLIPLFFDTLEPLRLWLADNPSVNSRVRAIASNPTRWKQTVASSRKHHAARTSPSARRAVGANVAARVLRTPDFDKLPNAPRMKNGRINFNALLKARAVTAYVGKMQLEMQRGPKPVTRPRIHIKNMVPVFNRDRGTMREWLRYAEDFGLLYCVKPPEKGKEGKWIAKPLVKGVDAPATATETAIAAALAGVTDDVLADGVWDNFAADLILSVGHTYWYQGPPTKSGPTEWWTLLQLHTGAPRKSDDDEGLYARFTSIADLDAAVTPEGRKARQDREDKRAIERVARKEDIDESRKPSDRVWRNLREKLDWEKVTDATLVEWTQATVDRVSKWPDDLASDIRSHLADSILPGKFARSTNLTAALHILRLAGMTPAERNLVERLGWESVTEPGLVEWTQSTILRLVSAPDELASSIRSTLIAAIPRRYSPTSNVEAALTLLKGAA